MLCITAPNKPTILPDDCSAENNSVTIAWQPHIGNVVESYSLELDDGDGGDFRVGTRIFPSHIVEMILFSSCNHQR